MATIPPWIATIVALFLSIVTGIVLYYTFVVSARQDLTTPAESEIDAGDNDNASGSKAAS